MSIAAKKARRRFRRTVRRDRVTLVLTMPDEPHGDYVYVDVRGWGQEAWADHDMQLLGSTWESYGDGRIWNMIPNSPDLLDVLREEGYSVDASRWNEPAEFPELPPDGFPCPVCGEKECDVLESMRQAS